MVLDFGQFFPLFPDLIFLLVNVILKLPLSLFFLLDFDLPVLLGVQVIQLVKIVQIALGVQNLVELPLFVLDQGLLGQSFLVECPDLVKIKHFLLEQFLNELLKHLVLPTELTQKLLLLSDVFIVDLGNS